MGNSFDMKYMRDMIGLARPGAAVLISKANENDTDT